ncbi:hypothetical protein ATCC90586_010131 [Pythium insidiosum]|nr:hypothetical protein ATCC90586_010131 [Pythium insidiosum]
MLNFALSCCVTPVSRESCEPLSRLLELGLCDVWSAIRKDTARSVASIVYSFPDLERVDEFIDTLIKITTSDDWKASDGALLGLDALITRIDVEHIAKSASRDAQPCSVHELIKGPFSAQGPTTFFHMGKLHRKLPQLPRSLVSRLKPALYRSLQHDQVSVRETAAQCLAHFVAICDDSMRVLTFQEVISKLNRLSPTEFRDEIATEDDANAELLDSTEAEGLLDVLARLLPSLSIAFLVKHWAVIFPTLERYVVHIASSCEPARYSICWQRLEGRLLSIDVVVSRLGKELMLRHLGRDGACSMAPSRRRTQTPSVDCWLPSSVLPHASWSVLETDDKQRFCSSPKATVIEGVDAWLKKHRASAETQRFWEDVIRGWIEQTQHAFESTQFELRRISRQLLPGLARLCAWLDELPQLLVASSAPVFRLDDGKDAATSAGGDSWQWSWLRSLLLHVQFLRETPSSTTACPAVIQSVISRMLCFATEVMVPRKQSERPSECDPHALVPSVESRILLWLIGLSAPAPYSGYLASKDQLWLLVSAFSVVHEMLPPRFQRLAAATRRSSLPSPRELDTPTMDRQLSIALVQLMPVIAMSLQSHVWISMDFETDEHVQLWWMAERLIERLSRPEDETDKHYGLFIWPSAMLIERLSRPEDETDKHYGLFIWPSAMVLARFVAFHHERLFRDKVVLELGCGTALPGILAAKCGHPKKVLLSDRSDAAHVPSNVEANIALNGVQSVASFVALDWGDLGLVDHRDTLGQVDIILAADCFYQSRDFESVIATAAVVFRWNPRARFFTTYQLRSISRSIAPLLERWRMAARLIDKQSFRGVCDDEIPGADSVYLYEITPRVLESEMQQ